MSAANVVVLGPQRLTPTLRDAVAEIPGHDPGAAHYAVVTAGWEEREGEHRELADELCEGVTLEDGPSSAELAAWTVLASTIYNLDITRTRE